MFLEAKRAAATANTPEEYRRAALLLEEAHEKGSGEASAAIANWYHYGIHYEKDELKEFVFAKTAAERGNADSYFALGAIYERGIRGFVRKNFKRALECYLESALLGEANAFMEVARCFEFGIGVEKNRRFATIWAKHGKHRGGQFLEPRS